MRPIVLAASALCLTCSGPSLAGAALQGSTPAVVAKASPADELEPGEGRRVAGALADQLLASFAIPDHARDYAAMLRTRAASGRYDKGPRAELARMLTDDLQAVHKDGHLRVMLAQPDSAPGSGGEGPGRGFPPLIQSAKTIAPGVGYIRFSAFLGGKEELAGVARWLSENETARTLIFDLRNHHGGGLAEQDLIFATLFAKPTPLVKMSVAKTVVDEGGFPFKASPTLAIEQVGGQMVATHSAVPGKASPLREAKVYLLVSNRTASAAEHFALALKSTGRATLIGEATAGANHFGGEQDLTEHFRVWMPVGRTYDIRTGQDWEGAGVAPDVSVDPRQALVVALERAGLSPTEAVRLDALEVPAEPVHSDKVMAR